MQSIGGGVWMFSMLAFEHSELNPERDQIQFHHSAISRSWPRRSQNVIDGAYLSYAFGADGTAGIRILADLLQMAFISS